MRYLTLAVMALGFAYALPAANIITVGDSDLDNPGTAFVQTNGPLAVSWTIGAGQTFNNVVIQAAIGFPTFQGGSAQITAFLTTQLGAGTTVAHQLAATGTTTVPNTTPNLAQALFTLPFGALTLGPGTYFLSVFPVSGGTAAWDFENPFTTTSDVGATLNGLFHKTTSIDGAYAPASAFTNQTFGPGFFSVTGDRTDVPEPATVALVALGLLGVALRRRRP